MTLIDRIKKMLGLTSSSADPVDEIRPSGRERADVTARSEGVSDEPAGLSSDVTRRVDEPYDPES